MEDLRRQRDADIAKINDEMNQEILHSLQQKKTAMVKCMDNYQNKLNEAQLKIQQNNVTKLNNTISTLKYENIKLKTQNIDLLNKMKITQQKYYIIDKENESLRNRIKRLERNRNFNINTSNNASSRITAPIAAIKNVDNRDWFQSLDDDAFGDINSEQWAETEDETEMNIIPANVHKRNIKQKQKPKKKKHSNTKWKKLIIKYTYCNYSFYLHFVYILPKENLVGLVKMYQILKQYHNVLGKRMKEKRENYMKYWMMKT